MASETTVQSSHVEEDKADECRENIPPGIQVEDVEEYSSIHPGGENERLSQTCSFSTPNSCGRVKTKPRLSGLPSALTPIIKNLDIKNKYNSPEAFKHGNKLHPPISPSSRGKTSQDPNTVSSLGGIKTSDDWLQDECLPEITLDDTYDCTMPTDISALPSSMPSTPVTAGLVRACDSHKQSQLGASTELKTIAEIPSLQNKTQDLEQSDDSDLKPEHQATDQLSKNTPETSGSCDAQGFALDRHSPNESSDNGALGKANNTVVSIQPQNEQRNVSETGSSDSHQITMEMPSLPKIFESEEDHSEVHVPELSADPNETTDARIPDVPENIDVPLRWLDQRFFPEITLLDVTRDPVVAQVSSAQVWPNAELSGQNSTTLNGSATPVTTINSSAEQSDKSPDQSTPKASLQLTQDISMGSVSDTPPLMESSVQNTAKVQTPADGTLAHHPVNVTHDLNSTRDVSVQSSDMPCNTSLKNLTTEIQSEPLVTSNTVEIGNDQLLTSAVAESNSNMSKPSPKPPCSLNSTFEKNSTRLSCGSSVSGEVGAGTFCIPNKTFDTTPVSKQNGTITLSSSRDWPQRTFDKLSTPSANNVTFTPKVKDSSSEIQPLKCPEPNTTTHEDPEVQMDDKPLETFGVLNKTEDHTQPELPTTDGLLDAISDHSIHRAGGKEANTLNFDDTLSLDDNCLLTSTPMPSCKFQPVVEWGPGRASVAQKKLYGEDRKELNGQVPPEVPSNIVCDRKTFLSRPTTGSLVPPSKPASQLLMFKRTSLLPSRFGPPTSGLPMTRQRSQAMMRPKPQPKTAAASASAAPQECTGIPASYNLRSSLQGPKASSEGLQKPQSSSIQRASMCLRPPTTRSTAPASTSTDKLRGPAATNPATKNSWSTKHPLTGGETLPTAKKKKMDIPVSSGAPERSLSSSVATNGARSLKQPATSLRALPAKRGDVAASASSAEKSSSFSAVNKARPPKMPVTSCRSAMPKSPGRGCSNCVLLEQKLEMKSAEMKRLEEGCSKCVLLEQQLEMKSAEIKRLEAELLKYRSPMEEES